MTPNVPSVPTISVGGNFTMGNVSDSQVAIGENIAQYKNCTFVLPDGSTVPGKSWLYTQGIRPNTDPAKIFGRRQELEKIDEFFKHTTALAITGFRGTGKSTLASMYLDVLEKRGSYAGIYWRKIDETIDISDVVGSFFTIIGKPIQEIGKYKIEDLLALFLRELHTAPYFLVLDNFEILIDPQANKPLKLGFSDLIEKANEITGKSRVLFTSWESPASERGIRPKCYPIGGLDETAAIQLLRENGLTDPDTMIKEAVKLCGSHPLALILLAQLVREGAETLSGILTDNTLWLGEKGEVAERILDKVYKERLNEEEQKLLQYLSLYRAPVPLQAIVVVASAPGWMESVIKKTALDLSRKSLLQKAEENYWEESLIQNYAYNKLVDKVERHKRACEYYLSLPLPQKPTKKKDVQPFIEAYHHACMAKEYDKASGIIFDKNLYEDLDRWGNCRTLVDLYAGLLPKDPFKDKSLLGDIQTHASVLGNLGIAHRALGDVRKAIGYYEGALEIVREIGDRGGEGARLGNLGNAYLDLGDVKKAIGYYEGALKIAREIGDRGNEGAWLGNLGTACSDLGDVKKAIGYYEGALEIAREIGDRSGEGAWLGNLGNAYRDLGDVKKAIGYYEGALKIAREIGDRRNEGIGLGNLGTACSDLGDVKKAIGYYEGALKIAREIGDRGNEGTWFNNLGNILTGEKKYREALACLLRARDIRTQIEAPELEVTESDLKALEEELGKKEFKKLTAEVRPEAEEIVKKMLGDS